MSQIIQMDINEKLLRQATEALACQGMTISDVMEIVLARVAREKGLPLDWLVPTEDTLEAMAEVQRGALEEVTLDQLRAELHEED